MLKADVNERIRLGETRDGSDKGPDEENEEALHWNQAVQVKLRDARLSLPAPWQLLADEPPANWGSTTGQRRP
jgi:hypothetical protein